MKAHLLLIPLLLVSPSLLAQSSDPAVNVKSPDPSLDTSVVTLRQEVRNVVVDVIVTDKHGLPITSLDKSSFQVLENGVPQNIEFFEQHSSSDLPPKRPSQTAPTLPADVHSNVAFPPADGPLIVLLLDALNTPASEQAYVRAQILDYLKQVSAGTHIAIFTMGSELQLIQGFTSDPAVLKAALDGRSYPTASPIDSGQSGVNTEGLRLGGQVIPLASSVAATRASLNRFSNDVANSGSDLQIRYTLDTLNALGVYLAGIPGRKNLIWFAGSIPWTINPDFSLVTSVTSRVDYTKELRNLSQVLTVGRIAVYPVAAGGLITPPGYDANSPNSAYARAGNGNAFAREDMAEQMNEAGVHMSIQNLAEATGGRAIYNTNGLSGAVAKVESIGENYYTLAYSPKDKRYDSTLRKLQIHVSAPDMKLDYRRGYYAEDPSRSTGRSVLVQSNPLRAVMQRGAPDATQIPFSLQTAQAYIQPDPNRPSDRIGNNTAAIKGPVVRYEFHWKVDLHSITFSPAAGGGVHGEVDAILAAYDADGKTYNDIYATLPLNFTNAQYNRFLRTGLAMSQILDLPAGPVFLRAGVMDPNTGHTGALEFPMMVLPPKPNIAQSSAIAEPSAP
jgi:VWFA-related protein